MRADYLGFVTTLQQRHGDLTRMRLVYEDAWDLMSPDLVREALVTHADRLIRWERGIEVFAQVCGSNTTAVLPPFLPVAAARKGLDQHLAGLGQEVAGAQWLDVFFIGMRARIGIEPRRQNPFCRGGALFARGRSRQIGQPGKAVRHVLERRGELGPG